MISSRFLVTIILLLCVTWCACETPCICGVSAKNDANRADCIRPHTYSITNNLTTNGLNQEVCMPYVVHKIPGLNLKMCHFPVMYQTQNFCQTINNILVCTIQNPQYSLAQCYPGQYYCTHHVQCPLGTILNYHCSSLSLTSKTQPVTSSSDCTDQIELETATNNMAQVTCGNQCFSDFVDFSVLVSFTSSQCCHHCGYFMWAQCVPVQHDIQDRDTEKESNSSSIEEQRFQEIWQKDVDNFTIETIHIPIGAKVIYDNSVIKIIGEGKVLDEYEDIDHFEVHGKRFGDLRMNKRSKITFIGFGTLFIGDGEAWYLEDGIPKNILSTSREKAYIAKALDFLVPFFLRKHETIFIPKSSYGIEKRAFGKPFNPKCTKSNVSGNCLALQRKPNQFQRKEALQEAQRQLLISYNPIVIATAEMVIHTLKKEPSPHFVTQ